MSVEGGPLPVLSELPLLYRGKVRDVYDAAEDRLLVLASDRISAFDVVFPDPVPGKGALLNTLSAWWFERTRRIVDNHLISADASLIFEDAAEGRRLEGRVSLVRRAEPIRFECVVRGFLDGSAWKEYERSGMVAGRKLPSGLHRYDKLPAPIFTPARKNLEGHDENITVPAMAFEFGRERTALLEKLSLALYRLGANVAAERGLTLLDTKFEFGFLGGGIILIDEVLTPDSSRFRAGERALDKQFLRDWLREQGWSGEGDPPRLPQAIRDELMARYREVAETLMGP